MQLGAGRRGGDDVLRGVRLRGGSRALGKLLVERLEDEDAATLAGEGAVGREDLVGEMASKVITERDLNGDSLVSSEELFEWCRRNTFNGLVEQFVQERA
mgnify:CR=1 FL=1